MTMVTPDISRIDSSNLNPLDFWNCGVQLISMNYQVCWCCCALIDVIIVCFLKNLLLTRPMVKL